MKITLTIEIPDRRITKDIIKQIGDDLEFAGKQSVRNRDIKVSYITITEEYGK